MRIAFSSTHRGIGVQRASSPNLVWAHQAHQDRGAQQKRPVRRLSFKNPFTLFDRHSQKQNILQVTTDAPARRNDSGPSKLAMGILLGAAVLLLATWQRLTARSARTEKERPTTEEDVQRDVDAVSLGEMLDAEAALQQRSIAEQLQVRIDQAQARILKAPTELRARIVKEEVQNLRALRQMASELYSYNAMSLEAEEMRAQLAGLKLRQTPDTPAAAESTDAPSEIASIDDSTLEQRRESGAAASSSDSFEDSAGAEGALASPHTVVTDERQREGEEVAELASRMWNGAAEEEPHMMNGKSMNGHHAERPEMEIVETVVGAEEASITQLELLAGGINLPHPAKASTGGEDAFFTSTAFCGAVGVADGVSGWAKDGVNAALYSRKLMRHAQEGVEMGLGSEQGAMGVLKHANTHTNDTDGSTTAVVAVMHAPNVCEIASVGDSGFRLIREGDCIFASEAQQHSFNCPFQLASQVRWPEADSPDDADVYEVGLLPGDILVLGSDGIFDNMWDSQLESIVREHIKAQPHRTSFTAEALARTLAQAARKNALDDRYRSPFIVEAAAAGVLPIWKRWQPRGGKLDDCTVVVVFAEPVQAPDDKHSQAPTFPVSAAA